MINSLLRNAHHMTAAFVITAIVLALTVFFLPLPLIVCLRKTARSLLSSDQGRRKLGAGAAAFYLVLFGLYLVWADELATFLVLSVIIILIFASQLFWFRQARELSRTLVPGATWRRRLGVAAVTVYGALLAYNFLSEGRPSPVRMTLRAALLEAPFRVWIASSLLGFIIAVLFGAAERAAKGLVWSYRAVRSLLAPRAVPDPPLARPSSDAHLRPSRRRFLEQTALALSATPFAGGVYGLLYGRLEVETTAQRIALRRLPRAFHGFRVAQLSDLHIGPFMSAEEIRRVVALTNQLKPDLILLTGDYITWDTSTQFAVVGELARLQAPFGVYGCLGNHELWTETEDSITRIFADHRIPILRQAKALVRLQDESLNLIGVDYQTARGRRIHGGHWVRKYLDGIEPLLSAETVNILLSHNPNAFDRASELGIDLTLAGHTHGGQVNLEFIHPSLSPSRLITPYVKGRFQKVGGQLYVNRGIGTIGIPIRLGAPPEITVFELLRA